MSTTEYTPPHMKEPTMQYAPIETIRERLIVVDVETTGFSTNNQQTERCGPRMPDRIVEISALEVENGALTGREYTTRVNPERHIPSRSTKVHRITDADVRDAPRFRDIAADLFAFIYPHGRVETIIMAHNAAFDRRFLNAEMKWAGIRPKNPDGTPMDAWRMDFDEAEGVAPLVNSFFCTFAQACMIWGKKGVCNKLPDVAERLGVPVNFDLLHSARDDAILTWECYRSMVAEAKRPEKMEDPDFLWRNRARPGIWLGSPAGGLHSNPARGRAKCPA